MNIQKVGFIGLGNMGIPMAHNLIKANYQVAVFNRTIGKADDLLSAGATASSSPAQLLTDCDVVILMVSDDKAINELVHGIDGLLNAEAEGKIIINMSTVSPANSQQIEKILHKHHYLDAPVSGSVKQAQEGSLVIMVGGDKAAFENAKPIFDCLGKLALWLGQSGSGNSAKLAINALLAFHAHGLAEAVAFATKQGIAATDLLTLLNNGAMGNVFMKIKGDAILNDNFTAAFALKHIVKDLRLANDAGLKSPLAIAAKNSFEAAQDDLGEEDIIAIYKKMSAYN